MKRKMIYIAPLALLGIAAFILLGGEVVRLLWNALLPPLFGFREVTFWQALGILTLSRILFGNIGGHGRGRMSREERARFRQAMHDRCNPPAAIDPQ